jgi:hypothetical protein
MNVNRRLIPLSTALVIALVTSTSQATRDISPATKIVQLGIAGRSNTAPWIAASGDFVAVAWGASVHVPGETKRGAGADLFVATSRDGGATFGAPVQVNAVPGEARVGGELPPRVAIARAPAGQDAVLVVLWTARGERTSIKLSQSTDRGRTFGAPEMLQAPDAAGDRGWPSLALDPQGRAHSVWLDHRGLAGHDAHGRQGTYDGVAMAQRSGLFISSGSGERELAKGVCYCCKTSLVSSGDGTLYASWRHVYPGNIRDIAFVSSRGGGRTFNAPSRVSEDGWQIEGCPDDGPAMAVDGSHVVHIVWPTMLPGVEPVGALFYATTRDGKGFTPRERIPTLGSLKPTHPQIVADGSGRVFVAWEEMIDGTRRSAVREVRRDGSGRPTFGPASELGRGEPAAYPVLAVSSRGVLAAWVRGAHASATIGVGVVDERQRSAVSSEKHTDRRSP